MDAHPKDGDKSCVDAAVVLSAVVDQQAAAAVLPVAHVSDTGCKMLCANPYEGPGGLFGCGQCMACRYNKRRIWTHRIILEALVHAEASFVTLTYNEEHLPDGENLCSTDLQLFIKRLRKNTGLRLRFFGVGEYGEINLRPHYHLALFGLGPRDVGALETAWSLKGKSLGIVHVGELEYHSAAYVCGYVTDKLQSKTVSCLRVRGRVNEFARMSRNPGIGAHSIEAVADALQAQTGWDHIARTGDVPDTLRHGKKKLPLGPYLRRKLRLQMGMEDEKQPKEAQLKLSKEMLAMWLDHVTSTENPSTTIKGMLLAQNKQARQNLNTRTKMFAQKRSI